MKKKLNKAASHPTDAVWDLLTDFCRTVRTLPAQYDEQPKAYIVGGYVRDLLLHVQPVDADIEVYGVSRSQLARLLTRQFPGADIVHTPSFYVWKVRVHNFELSFSLPRIETKTGTGYRDFTIVANPSIHPRQATLRRDFTINALLLDPIQHRVLDFVNGKRDITARILRAVDISHLADDPRRAWRALQSIGRFKLTVDRRTEVELKKMSQMAKEGDVSGTHVRTELDKLFLYADTPSRALRLAKAWGLLKTSVPELATIYHSPKHWRDILAHIDATKDLPPHIRLVSRWQVILKALEPAATQALIRKLSIPRKIRTRAATLQR